MKLAEQSKKEKGSYYRKTGEVKVNLPEPQSRDKVGTRLGFKSGKSWENIKAEGEAAEESKRCGSINLSERKDGFCYCQRCFNSMKIPKEYEK